MKSTSARPDHIIASTVNAPATISVSPAQDVFGALLRALSSTVLAKNSTAISKKMMKKISMLMPCTPRIR